MFQTSCNVSLEFLRICRIYESKAAIQYKFCQNHVMFRPFEWCNWDIGYQHRICASVRGSDKNVLRVTPPRKSVAVVARAPPRRYAFGHFIESAGRRYLPLAGALRRTNSCYGDSSIARIHFGGTTSIRAIESCPGEFCRSKFWQCNPTEQTWQSSWLAFCYTLGWVYTLHFHSSTALYLCQGYCIIVSILI